MRQAFAHRHDEAEEVYVVLSGSGRVRLDDEILDLVQLDAIRIAPWVTRCFESGEDGLELLVFGPRCPNDAEMVPDWWTDPDLNAGRLPVVLAKRPADLVDREAGGEAGEQLHPCRLR